MFLKLNLAQSALNARWRTQFLVCREPLCVIEELFLVVFAVLLFEGMTGGGLNIRTGRKTGVFISYLFGYHYVVFYQRRGLNNHSFDRNLDLVDASSSQPTARRLIQKTEE